MQHRMTLHPPAAHRGLARPRTCQCVSAVLHAGTPRSAAASGSPPVHKHHHKAARGRALTVVVRADSDYYDLLGVSKNADKKTIKQAYRQKARKYHPDVNKEPGAEELFKRIGEAYEVLSDDNKKAIYDRYGEAGLKGSMGGMGGQGQGDFSNPFDLFESFFGRDFMNSGMGGPGRQRRTNVPGEDQNHELQLDFLDAVFGCSKEIDVDKMEACKACDSTGAKAGTTPSGCPQCQGSGQVFSALRTPLGTFQQVAVCPRCEGEGQIGTPCEKCNGSGRVKETKRISLKIPPGVDSGSRLRVRGEGNSGRRNGEPGDLYVYITVKEHPEGLRRDGTTIHSDVEIPFVDAILGSQVKVTTVDGPVELKIPPGTQPGTTLLMSKRGVPRLGNPSLRGDHMVHVRVKIPKTISADERKLVEELRELQSQPKVGPFRF